MLLLRFANDLEEYAKVESMPSLEGKKMFLYLSPKKAGQAKKSQQARDREENIKQLKAESTKTEEKGADDTQSESTAANINGLFANAKISAEALAKLQKEE